MNSKAPVRGYTHDRTRRDRRKTRRSATRCCPHATQGRGNENPRKQSRNHTNALAPAHKNTRIRPHTTTTPSGRQANDLGVKCRHEVRTPPVILRGNDYTRKWGVAWDTKRTRAAPLFSSRITRAGMRGRQEGWCCCGRSARDLLGIGGPTKKKKFPRKRKQICKPQKTGGRQL